MIGVGQKVGSCEVLRLLGRGGIGDVYAGIDRTLERRVAIKALRPEFGQEPGFIDRFRAEAKSLAQLNHPNIATLYSLHMDDRALCMIMEFVSGRTLEEIITTTGRLTERDSLAIIAQATDGLACAHKSGIVHRDVKPANMMVTSDGVVKITDFGIALMRGAKRLTQQGRIVGTVAYMAPEQILGGTPDQRTDIYSLAIVLYEMLSGTTPFVGDSEYELLRMQVEAMPPRLLERVPDLSPPVGQAVMRALAKQPAERFSSMEEFADALGASALRPVAMQIVRARVSTISDAASGPPTVDALAMPNVAVAKAGETRQFSPRSTQDFRVEPGVRTREATPGGGRHSASAALSFGDKKTPVAIAAMAALLLLGAGYLGWSFLAGNGDERTVAPGARSPDSPSSTLDPERLAAAASGARTSETPPKPVGAPDRGQTDRPGSEGAEAPVVPSTIMAPPPQTALVKPAPPPAVTGPSQRTTTKAGIFQDCPYCPQMVEVTPGSFQMGSHGEDAAEQPPHEVTLKSHFAIGVLEVTYGEWMACVHAGGCTYAPELPATSDRVPMRNVSWADAVQYTEWLKKVTQQPYRLPTEAEWEYAARANGNTRYPWGNEPGLLHANCKGCGGDWSREAPAAAGSFPPNGFGVYDMSGSVWEWVRDCWHGSYKGAPTDGAAWESPSCQQRVLRGGSWRDDPQLARSSSRFYYDADVRYIANGFRVALSLQ